MFMAHVERNLTTETSKATTHMPVTSPVLAVLQHNPGLDKWKKGLSGPISAIAESLIALGGYNTCRSQRRRRHGSSYTKATHLPNVFKKFFCQGHQDMRWMQWSSNCKHQHPSQKSGIQLYLRAWAPNPNLEKNHPPRSLLASSLKMRRHVPTINGHSPAMVLPTLAAIATFTQSLSRTTLRTSAENLPRARQFAKFT